MDRVKAYMCERGPIREGGLDRVRRKCLNRDRRRPFCHHHLCRGTFSEGARRQSYIIVPHSPNHYSCPVPLNVLSPSGSLHHAKGKGWQETLPSPPPLKRPRWKSLHQPPCLPIYQAPNHHHHHQHCPTHLQHLMTSLLWRYWPLTQHLFYRKKMSPIQSGLSKQKVKRRRMPMKKRAWQGVERGKGLLLQHTPHNCRSLKVNSQYEDKIWLRN